MRFISMHVTVQIIKSIIVSSFFVVLSAWAVPACAETVSYQLYMTLGPVSVRTGKAKLDITPVTYRGQRAVHSRLAMQTGSGADVVFTLRDTVQSYYTSSGRSLYYSKTVNEGSRHNFEEAVFDNRNGLFNVELSTWDKLSDKRLEHAEKSSPQRIFDMLSLLDYARGIKTGSLVKGREIAVLPMVNGAMVVDQHLIYEGRVNVKTGTGLRKDCLKVSVRDWKYGSERETLVIYADPNDGNLPVRLDIVLGGAALSARLSDYSK